jgi:hypothetical protein
VNPTRDNAVGDTGFEPVPLPGQRSISAWEFRRVWGLEPVQGRLCLPPCGVVGRLEQASQRARGRCRIVAVPKALLRTRALSRQWSPPVGGPDPIRRTPISASQRRWCLRLRACRGRVRRGVGRNPVIGGPGPCHVEQDQHKICAGNGSEDRGDQSYQSYATASAAKSSNGPTQDHRAFTTARCC